MEAPRWGLTCRMMPFSSWLLRWRARFSEKCLPLPSQDLKCHCTCGSQMAHSSAIAATWSHPCHQDMAPINIGIIFILLYSTWSSCHLAWVFRALEMLLFFNCSSESCNPKKQYFQDLGMLLIKENAFRNNTLTQHEWRPIFTKQNLPQNLFFLQGHFYTKKMCLCHIFFHCPSALKIYMVF